MTDLPASNQLTDAISPYLRQHADNPVAWWPWNDQALNLARREDLPILLSIGYSACHWCHVMAHECFENEDIAALMNTHFVNVKVDREERPDLDRIYQVAHQLLTGRGGGWPLTVFIDPHDLAAFYAGTYFPPEPRHGMIAFPQLLDRLAEVWRTRRSDLSTQNAQLRQALATISRAQPGEVASDAAEALVARVAAQFDREHGGFGRAPKFPQAPMLNALINLTDDDEQVEQMMGDTLRAMARNGLQDHLAGGFFRYCVDAAWEIPHFEKMLIDNAQLLGIYARAAARWDDAEFAATCRQLVNWLSEEMALPGGGFASSLDADSPDGEGASYLWQPAEITKLLENDADLLVRRFGLDGPANFEGRAWHLVIARGIEELVDDHAEAGRIEQRLEAARRRLLAERRRRPAPGRDDKLLATANALLAESLITAASALRKPEWIELAADCLDAVAVRLFGHEPPRAVWRDGRAGATALLDDHAATLLACLAMLGQRWEDRWFNLARRLARRIQQHFADVETGALYLTPGDHEPLLFRPLSHSDDASPSGAGLAVIGLARLSQLTGEPELENCARRALAAASGDIQRAPTACATLIRAAIELDQPPATVLIGGPTDDAASLRKVLEGYPWVLAYHLPAAGEDHPDWWHVVAGADQATAQVCLGRQCLRPVHSADELARALDETVGHSD